MENLEKCGCPLPMCDGEMTKTNVVEVENGKEITITVWICDNCGYKHVGGRPLL